MDQVPNHHCPACGKAMKAFLRYPWHVCDDCLARCEDAEGRRVEFTNVSVSGGLAFRRVGEMEWSAETGQITCLLDGRPVLVREARFGGVVAEPLTAGPAPRDTLNLTR